MKVALINVVFAREFLTINMYVRSVHLAKMNVFARIVCDLKEITTQLCYVAKTMVDEIKLWQTLEINKAWRRRELHEAWRLCRSCTGTKKGSKRRWGHAPMTSNLRANSSQRFGKPAVEGGWGAEQLQEFLDEDFAEDTYEQLVEPRLHRSYPAVQDVDDEEFEEELKLMRKRASKMKNRKYVPPWEIPAGIWKLLMMQQFVHKLQRRRIPGVSTVDGKSVMVPSHLGVGAEM